jgi:hypothetical protein
MLNPLMLLGLLGLSVPIVIHLIQRQRLRPQQFATLQFLDNEDVANAFAPMPRDLLQLLLRLLLLGLFVMLMTRLFTGANEVGPRTMAVVLDRSMSMQQKVGEKSNLFEQSRAQLLELIAGMRQGDKLSLLVVGDEITQETPYLEDTVELRKIVESVQVSDSGALALVPTIRAAVNQLRSRREVNACVIVFSDQQQLNYAPYVAEATQEGVENETIAFRKALVGSNVSLLLVTPPATAGANLAIDAARFSPERVYDGASSRLTAVVRNRTDEVQTAVLTVAQRTTLPAASAKNAQPGAAPQSTADLNPTEVATGADADASDSPGLRREVELQPGEAAHVDLAVPFDSPLDSASTVSIEDDVLPGDNSFHLPMRMKARRRILLVTPPDPSTEEERGLELGYRGIDLLAYALNPAGYAASGGTGGPTGMTYIDVKRITSTALERVPLTEYGVLVLHGVTELANPERSLKDLQSFVASGGSLWLIPQRDVSPLRFNETFGPLLKGLSLAQLKQPDAVQTLERGEAQLQHPLLLPLVREEWGSIGDVYFSEFFGLQSSGSGQATLRTANGDPLALMIPIERGHVYVQLFDCDLESSSLPRSPAFVPMVQQIITTLADRGDKAPPDAIRVGEELRLRLPEFRNLSGDVVVRGPETKTFPLTGPEGEEIRIEGLRRAGAYVVEHPARAVGRQRWITVNPVEGESELVQLSPADQAALFGETGAARVTFAELPDHFAKRREWTSMLLVLVMIAFAAEALLGAWQSRKGARVERAEER